MKRSEFVGLGAALGAGFGLGVVVDNVRGGAGPSAEGAGSEAAPDLILVNGRVYTQDDGLPQAEAFAIKDGRFLAVGSSDDVRNLAAPGRTQIVDAEGMTVMPGFIDAHSHPSGAGLNALTNVNTNLGSVANIQAAIADRASRTPPDEWIVGYMYDDTKLSEGRPLNRYDLDEAAPNHPVAVGHRGGHTGVYNSRALALAGVSAETPNPPGGMFYRENGELTGKAAETARNVFRRFLNTETTPEQRRDGVAAITREMTAAGLTSVHETGVSAESYKAYQDARAAGELRMRIYALARGPSYEALLAAGVRTGMGDEWLRVGAVKFTADGSASERTMYMSTPYVGRPDDYGILIMPQEEINEEVERAHRAGWQIGIHANGDRTIEMVLNAYERAQRMWPREDTRHRIEHCSLVNPTLLERIRDLGVIPTPFYTYVYYHGDKWGEYGEEKMQWMFPHRSFLDYDIPVASASDHTPGPYEPMMALQSMVTRIDFRGNSWGENQKVTVDEAIHICTVNAARASFEEDIKGTITTGKVGDFVILGADPHDVDPSTLKDIPIVRTVVGGTTMHEA